MAMQVNANNWGARVGTGLTCLTCCVELSDGESQRHHYKQEWHAYNLKRKLAQLPPLSQTVFDRIQQQHIATHDKCDANNGNKLSLYCDACGKHFNNEKAFAQHSNSKKHQSSKSKDTILVKTVSETKVAKDEKPLYVDNEDEDSDWESVSDDDSSDERVRNDIEVNANECLFCDQISDSIEHNVCHMTANHSFFIPDVEYVIDLLELIKYLSEKIGWGYRCIWCCDSGKRFRSKLSVQRHMRDKGHTKMRYSGETLLEYSNFYDYTSSYPDADQSDSKLDEEVSLLELPDDDWQLTLPSGTVIGHRSLFRYYKQNLRPIDVEKTGAKSRAILGKIVSHYRGLGWTGTSGDAALRKAKDIKFMQNIQRRYALKVGQKHNRVLQPHFRSQIGF